MQFPWVVGNVKVTAGQSEQTFPCRLRYDGDFTYMMSGGAPNRPLFMELLEGSTLHGAQAFRLHTMRFDSSMLREKAAAHVFREFAVPVPTVTHAAVHF